MGLRAFLKDNDVIQSVEIISFENVPPQYVGLRVSGTVAIFVVNEMLDHGDRIEVGSLRFVRELKGSQGSELREIIPGGQVISCDYLISPECDEVAGVRIGFEDKELTITTGDAPYSIFVEFDGITRGRSEYPLDRYRCIS